MGKLIFSEFISLPVKMGMEILCCIDVWIRDKLCQVPGAPGWSDSGACDNDLRVGVQTPLWV